MTIGDKDEIKLQHCNNKEFNSESPDNVRFEIANFKQMFKDLSKNEKIIFVSQNIDDPDLEENDKFKIAHEIFEESQLKFIHRFGKFLSLDHLKLFQNTQNDEIDFMVQRLEMNLTNYHKNVRNRRYYALKNMITKNEYFSEKEMMKRDPLLYEELIGQYLNESEKKIRDGLNMKNTNLSEILLNEMDKDYFKLKLKNLKDNEKNYNSDDDSSCSVDSENDCYQMENEQSCIGVQPSFYKKWGEFEDSMSNDNEISAGTNKITNATTFTLKSKVKSITDNEKELLREEFITIMHNRFLNGEDKNFDYTDVDENSTNDDLKIQQQDLEDKYFDESSSDDEIIHNDCINNDDEDDLDIFMKQLNENYNLNE